MSDTPIKLSSKEFGLKIYNRFPPKYREDDYFQNLSLKRFLEVLADGGFSYVIEDTNGLLDLHDPEKTSKEGLFALYEQFGLKMFNGIPEEYLRTFLPHLGEAWSSKGSLSVIEYVIGSLSGIKVSTEVTYQDDNTAIFGEGVFGKAIFNNKDSYLHPVVKVRLEMDYNYSDYFPNAEQFKRILENFVPVYVQAVLTYSYFYEDSFSVVGKESDKFSIIDEKEESKTLLSEDSVHNSIQNSYEEAQGLFHYENNPSTLGVGVLNEFLLGWRPVEDRIYTNLTDSKALVNIDMCESTLITKSIRNATFGSGKIGYLILGDNSYDHKHLAY